MDLSKYLETQKSICAFNPEIHQESVFRLLEEHAMNVAGIHLTYERRPAFNRLLEMQAPVAISILAKDANAITGIFSVSAGLRYINGKKVSTAYIGDFRTNGNPRTAKLWRNAYAEILKCLSETERLGKPQYFLTAILADNKVAIRNLVDSKKDLGFYYQQLKSVDMVNIYGRYPSLSSTSDCKARFAMAHEEQTIREFCDRHERLKAFGAVMDSSTESEWQRRSQHWPGFKIEKFVMVEDQNEKLVAVALPWSPSSAKRMRVTSAPFAVKWLFSILSIFGYNMPAVGKSIETCYLTHLNIETDVDQKNVVVAILNFLIAEGLLKSAHMLSFADWWGINLKGFISQRIPVNLYAVTTQKGISVQELHSDAIGFEMGLV